MWGHIKELFSYVVWPDNSFEFTYLYLPRHSPGAGWAGLANRVDHVSNGSTPGSVVLCELTRHLHLVLSPSCLAENLRPEICSRSALIVVAHVFSFPQARLRHMRGSVGRRTSLVSSPSGRLAAWLNQRSLLCTSSAGMRVRQTRRVPATLNIR